MSADTSQLKQQVADQIRALVETVSSQVADGVSTSDVWTIIKAVASTLIGIAGTLKNTTGIEKKELVDELFREIYTLHIAPKWDAPGFDPFVDKVILSFAPTLTQLVYDALKGVTKVAAVLALLLIPMGVADAGPVFCRDGTCYRSQELADKVAVIAPQRERPLFRRSLLSLFSGRCCR